MRNRIFYLLPILFFFSLFFLSSCKQYHNVTARYNAYFLSKERMKEAEEEIFLKRKDDYNNVLLAIPETDTNAIPGFYLRMVDCLKKAALIIENHKESNWVDAGYVLIGKSRFYMRDYTNALITLKYVNTQGKTDEDRHDALIELMRVFIEMKKMTDAKTVFSYMLKQSLSKDNLRDFYIVAAHYYRMNQNYKGTAKYLTKALPLMRNGEHKGRNYFILGQIYQKFDLPDEAFRHYKKVLRNNPPYELIFNTRLNMAQVHNFKDAKDGKKIIRYFNRLLRDDKNIDYKDKIYYEMGIFELKRNRVKEGADYLELSVKASTINKTQKGYSFLKLAQINYEKLQNFELASNYYDSALVNLPNTIEDYDLIVRRREVLTDFIKQLRIVRLEDSLQRYARMNKDDLGRYLDYELLKQETKKQEEFERMEAERARAAAKQQSSGTLNSAINQSSQWYFYNINAITLGKKSFIKEWGNRELEDNWRRSSRSEINEERDSADMVVQNVILREDIIKKRVQKRKDDLMNIIPFEKEQYDSSRSKMEVAMYELGKIYRFDLKEPKNTIKTFEEFVKEFPENHHIPEVLYFLYLTNRDIKNTVREEKYKNEILTRFPNSVYAKILQNPNYLAESKKAQKEVSEAYKKAYELYEGKHFVEAEEVINQTLQQFPENVILDKFAFLQVMISIRTKDAGTYKKELEDFIQDYPDSNLLERARSLLEKIKQQ